MDSGGDRQQQRGESRISWRTLLVASGASVAAAFVVSSLWAPGTLIGAAVTPVIVALVSELLRKPIEAVPAPSAALAPLLPRTGGGPAAAAQQGADDVRAAPIETPADVPGDRAGDGPVVAEYARSDYRTWDRRRIRMALVTGALAFLIAVGFFVVADLTTGSAVTGRGGGSSLFSPRNSSGDGASRPATTTTTPRETTTQPSRTSQSAPPAQQTTEQPPATTPTTPEPAPRTTEEPATPQPAPAPATPPSGEAAPQQEPAP